MSPALRKSIILVAVVVVIIMVAALYGDVISARAIRDYLVSVRALWWSPLLFILLYCLFALLLLPATILTLTAGVIWGWLAGGLWVLAASSVASAIPYLIARRGGGWVEQLLRRRAGRIHELLQSEGFTTLIMMRLVPLVPYPILNYAAGFAGLRPRDYFPGTFLGTIPAIFTFTYLAEAITSGAISGRDAFARILIGGALLAGLILATRLTSKRLKRRLRSDE